MLGIHAIGADGSWDIAHHHQCCSCSTKGAPISTSPTSEAASYLYLSRYQQWLTEEMQDRALLEEFARDSYENLLFSLCRFYEATGGYPERVTVVGFDFKAYRFEHLHRKAIGFPDNNFSYLGVHPQHPAFDHDGANGERTRRWHLSARTPMDAQTKPWCISGTAGTHFTEPFPTSSLALIWRLCCGGVDRQPSQMLMRSHLLLPPLS